MFSSRNFHTPRLRRRRMTGQVMSEYVIVAGVLAMALFVKVPWADRSVFQMLIDGFRKAWASYSYTISLPW